MQGLINFKTTSKSLEATGIWLPQKMLQISRTIKKSNKTVLSEADATRSLRNKKHKHQAKVFLLFDEKRETGTACNTWDDRRKTTRIDVELTNKVAKCSTSDN